MSNPEPTGSTRPTRAAGYALLAVAAASLVLGVVSLFTGGEDTSGAQPGQPPASTAGSPTSDAPPSAPAETTTDAPTSTDTTTDTTTGAPATTTTAPATDTPPPPVTPENRQPVRVYNNSTVPNLAARASTEVRSLGWQVTETDNYSQGQIPTTTVYFRPGTDEEAQAKQLAELIGARAEPRFEGIVKAHPGIIVIVTNDYRGPNPKAGS
ncbi:LytR C-terminal domain-containing protein [Saccharothrix coeruleofusca]|uniref:LytR/CpsA/Psr regulator C-terminal domain-containing protein n=1 Tax=Saccharothrix coeruleofusca TaxID=33919 RepID=A0A918AGM3_9PSEU|nr:LytR C-terminal domain-containing protein [Saccharothrix coeruleofusca]MBP2340471.1 ABC-type Fe3+-hydroxamate transport system substrate-binding protein [Saccharothrix coeruleofusca]GGP35140.1 hypothetical protein GCM10010185_02410 [Saccharothrix coeruleofusca]